MFISSIAGTTTGTVIQMGTTLFLAVSNWNPPANEAKEAKAARDANPSIYNPQGQIIFGFKEKDGDWVLCQNERGIQAVGLALNAINKDKKVRLSYDDFDPIAEQAYLNALNEEHATFVI